MALGSGRNTKAKRKKILKGSPVIPHISVCGLIGIAKKKVLKNKQIITTITLYIR